MTDDNLHDYELNPSDVFHPDDVDSLKETLVQYFSEQTGTCVKGLGWSLNVTVTFDESDQED